MIVKTNYKRRADTLFTDSLRSALLIVEDYSIAFVVLDISKAMEVFRYFQIIVKIIFWVKISGTQLRINQCW